MNKFSNLVIHKICNFLIDFNDLISLSLVSKTFREICKIKIDDIKNDYETIENILRTPKITLKEYCNIKEFYNFLSYNILNSWYKYGYYIFKLERQLHIPKLKKLKIKKYQSSLFDYRIIIKKKRK
tara:strand:- start:90 stop:467 length:378 start_codon:yes stop_codon:yes gene_type:complete